MWDPQRDLTRRNKAKGEELVRQAWERARYILETQGGGEVNQSELAPKVGVHQTTVSGWLTGKYRPAPGPTLMLPEALGVNPLWLFYGLGEAHATPVGHGESRAAYYRGVMREALVLQEYAGERLRRLRMESAESPVTERADTIAAARREAVPLPPADETRSGHPDRRAGTGDTPPRSSGASGA